MLAKIELSMRRINKSLFIQKSMFTYWINKGKLSGFFVLIKMAESAGTTTIC